MTTRERLVITVGVQLGQRGEQEERLARAVEEWLDGNKWAGRQFDKAGWSFSRFVADVTKVWRSVGEGEIE
jgi:hypothetical protein